MTDRELMQFLLEVLDNHIEDPRAENLIEKSCKLLRERLSQPEPEHKTKDREAILAVLKKLEHIWELGVEVGTYKLSDDLLPEIKALRDFLSIGWKPLYTAPPKKKWVGLTLEEVNQCYEETVDEFQFAQIIEAKLKEKNT